jgi:hypothetical protein
MFQDERLEQGMNASLQSNEWYQLPALALLFLRLYFFKFEVILSFQVEKTGFSVQRLHK